MVMIKYVYKMVLEYEDGSICETTCYKKVIPDYLTKSITGAKLTKKQITPIVKPNDMKATAHLNQKANRKNSKKTFHKWLKNHR